MGRWYMLGIWSLPSLMDEDSYYCGKGESRLVHFAMVYVAFSECFECVNTYGGVLG